MTKTPNYNLNQWDPEDKVIRTDFNKDNAKLDTALTSKADASTVSALQTTVAGKADASIVSALQTTVAGKADASVVSALQTTVAGKADTSALTALQTVVDGKGNCNVVYGTYKGQGSYGSASPTRLSLGFAPRFVIVSGNGAFTFLVNGDTRAPTVIYGGVSLLTVTWTSTGVSWYISTIDSSSVLFQLNNLNQTYQYIAFR